MRELGASLGIGEELGVPRVRDGGAVDVERGQLDHPQRLSVLSIWNGPISCALAPAIFPLDIG
jgi:hypothetical protein